MIYIVFPDNKVWYFMQIENFQEKSNTIFCEKDEKKKKINLSSSKSAHTNIYP